MATVDIAELLRRKQAVLAARLGLGDAFSHPTARGDVKEFNWVEMLSDFLPKRYSISRGAFVIDSHGKKTSEIDLVIHDHHFNPELFEAATRRLIPAESVYAVFEIKPSLTGPHLDYAIRKTQEVRRLHRTSVPVVHAGGTHDEDRREPLRITAGILANRSSFSDPFGKTMARKLDAAPKQGRLDIGYAVEHGAFAASYEGKSAAVQIEEAENGLLFFLSHLFTRLQKAGTVPAIDLAAYQETQ
jgi:hypothetical protein